MSVTYRWHHLYSKNKFRNLKTEMYSKKAEKTTVVVVNQGITRIHTPIAYDARLYNHRDVVVVFAAKKAVFGSKIS